MIAPHKSEYTTQRFAGATMLSISRTINAKFVSVIMLSIKV